MIKNIFLVAATSLILVGCGSGGNSSGSGGSSGGAIGQPGGQAGARACAPVVMEPERVRSFCNASSWVAGVSEMCGGTLQYRDYVYDDYGANTGLTSFPILTGPLSPSAGDVKYPAGQENTADLVNFSMRLEGAELVLSFELNTLYSADQTIAAIAIDSDNDVSTGGGTLPGLGISAPGWDVFETFGNGDPERNIINGRMPRPDGDTWRVFAVVAQADGTVMNVAFRGINEEARAGGSLNDPSSILLLPNVGDFWEDKQAAALGAGDIGEFSALVCPADMQAGLTRGMEITPGLHQRVYTSQYTLDRNTGEPVPPDQTPGEGLSPAGIPGRHGNRAPVCEQFFHFLGKYQPYGFYLPDQPGPHGFQLLLHGCAANHASQVNQPGFQADFGEGLNRIIAAPLGRGPVGFYSDISERDVLDVYADVLANENVDPESVVLGGYSMGGYGALRLGALYPHLWAAVTNWVGFTGRVTNAPLGLDALLFPVADAIGGLGIIGDEIGAIGNVIDLVQNLRHIPTVSMYGALDELVQVNTGLAMGEVFAAQDVEQEFYLNLNAEHLTFIALDSWQREADFSRDRRRVRNPSRVTYRTDAALAYPEYDLRHDRAYWLHDIVAAGDGYSDLDAITYGCGTPENEYALTNTTGSGPTPLAWTLQKKAVSGLIEFPEDNRLTLNLSNVSSVTVDLAGACLSSDPVNYQIETTGPVTLRLSDGREIAIPAAGTFDGSLY